MKIKISDMMDHLESVPMELEELELDYAEGVKAEVRRKLREAAPQLRGAKRVSRVGLVAAVLAAALCISVGAAAICKWGGFALTGSMSEGEKMALLAKVAALPGGVEVRDEDGTVHYLDETGKEVLVLSAQEAAKHEQELLRAQEQTVRESTALVDADTLPLMPSRIMELDVDENGAFADVALGAGSMIVLHPSGKDGFELEAGDTVTIRLTASDVCYLQFGMIKNGTFAEAETHREQEHSHTFTVEGPGLYCFYVEYYSSDASTFTDGKVTVQ